MEISNLLQKFADHRIIELPAYALQEPFRWIADTAVMDAFESKVLDLPDFYFTGDDYRYRFETEAKRRFLALLRERFNAGTKYNGRTLKWDTVIERKVVELARYFLGRSETLDFSEPLPELGRADYRELRERLQNLSPAKARKLGFGKSTFQHLRWNARNRSSFKVYAGTMNRLMSDAR